MFWGQGRFFLPSQEVFEGEFVRGCPTQGTLLYRDQQVRVVVPYRHACYADQHAYMQACRTRHTRMHTQSGAKHMLRVTFDGRQSLLDPNLTAKSIEYIQPGGTEDKKLLQSLSIESLDSMLSGGSEESISLGMKPLQRFLLSVCTHKRARRMRYSPCMQAMRMRARMRAWHAFSDSFMHLCCTQEGITRAAGSRRTRMIYGHLSSA